MMLRSIRCCLITSFVCIAALTGCKKQTPKADEAAEAATAPESSTEATADANAPAADILPGAADVRAALAKKEYSSAVERYFSIKGFVATPEQKTEYDTLYDELRTSLQEHAGTDPKAAQALSAFQVMRNGR